jgi:hypothetical protein
MRRVFIRELSFHTVNSLARILDVDESKAVRCVEQLTACGVLKLRTTDDGREYDSSYPGSVRGSYQFVYVGLVIFEELCLVVYPKYLPEEEPSLDDIRQIFRVLRRSGGNLSQLAAVTDDGIHANNRFAVMLALLEMYDEYGLYVNYVKYLADNGPGDINWERTIAANQPYFSRGVPIYFDCKTVETDKDTADYVTRLHRYVLTECSHFMQETGIADLLSLDELNLGDSERDDFGDRDYICYRLNREKSVQFVTWKQRLLDLLYCYIAEEDSVIASEDVACLGTSSFYHVWELACKTALDDLLMLPIGALGLVLEEKYQHRSTSTLLDIVPRPLWRAGDGSVCGPVDTLIPDTVCFKKRFDGSNVFCIFDAKYYTPVLGANVMGVPGVESITKQILYQSAYSDFIVKHGFAGVVNAFIVPSSTANVELMGSVSFPGVFEAPSSPFVSDVKMWALPARRVFDSYLEGKPMADECLECLWNGSDGGRSWDGTIISD